MNMTTVIRKMEQTTEKTEDNGARGTVRGAIEQFGWSRRSLQDTGDGSVCMMGALCQVFGQEYNELALDDPEIREYLRALYDSRLNGTTTSPEGMDPERMVEVIIGHNDLGVTFENDARAWAGRADRLMRKREKEMARGHRLVKKQRVSRGRRTPARWSIVFGSREVAQVSGRREGSRNLWFFSPRGSSSMEGPFGSRLEAVQAALGSTILDPESVTSYSKNPRRR
jgi:hypothetical protein